MKRFFVFPILLATLVAGTAFARVPRLIAAPAPTAVSQIWLDPALPGTPEAAEFAARGYERTEFFQSGTANVYGYDPAGKVRVERSNIPYTTRVIVIRPKDPRRFSGTVQLNPFHPLNGMSAWSVMARYAMDNGDAFVGVMIGADDNTRKAPPGDRPVMATKVLGWFNAERYAPIVWPEDEDGIRWDVFAQTAEAIRSRAGLFDDLKPRIVIASGWSFTGSFLRTFINSGFHDRNRLPGGKPLIDGYLLGISSFTFRSGYVPINSRSANLEDNDPRRRNLPIDVPVIELQSENEAITNRDPQTPDRDRSPGAHRLYEIPGLTHGMSRSNSAIPQIQIAARTRQPAPPPAATGACTLERTDLDISDYGVAALENLDRWIRTGVAPPRAPRMRFAGGKGMKDPDGNTLGGVRPAQIAVPLAAYGEPPASSGCAPRSGGLGSPAMEMRRMPFTPERLRALYPGGKSEYLRRFDAAVDRLVAERWLRPADAARQKTEARAAAERAFS